MKVEKQVMMDDDSFIEFMMRDGNESGDESDCELLPPQGLLDEMMGDALVEKPKKKTVKRPVREKKVKISKEDKKTQLIAEMVKGMNGDCVSDSDSECEMLDVAIKTHKTKKDKTSKDKTKKDKTSKDKTKKDKTSKDKTKKDEPSPIENAFYKLKAFTKGKHNYLESTEIIDTDKLAFIVNNRDIFEPLLGADRGFRGTSWENYDPFLMASKYLSKSRKGVVKVLYKQKNGIGRKYSIGSLSLQNITRQIRQAICLDFYLDIDIKNCHPNILRFICDCLGISCPILKKYCDHRDQFFKDNNLTKKIGKDLMLSVLNGGRKAYNVLENKTAEITLFFTTELPNIHDIIIYKQQKIYNEFYEARKEEIDPKTGRIRENHKACFINVLMCDIENKMLDVMYEFFGKDKNAVLCFDGIMLPKDREYDILGCEKAIFDKLNISITLDIKPFEDAYDMSIYEIPKYVEMSLDYYTDFKNMVNNDVYEELVNEWEKETLVLIENGGKHFFLTKNKEIDSLTKDERVYYKQVREDDVFKNLKVKCNVLNPKFDFKLMKKIKALSPKEQKEFKENLSSDDLLTLKKYMYDRLGYCKGKGSVGYLEEAMENRTLNSFNHIEFAPYLSRNGVPKLFDSFNTFTGFPLERVEIEGSVDFTDSRLYKHIKEEMMDNNEGEFEHFLDHIADMIQDPMNIKTNGHLFYTKQGMGKGMLAEFVSKLLGVDHTISFENTEAYFGKFNADQQNKLLKIFEEVSDKGSAFQNHDRLKGDQSKKQERVEPKGIDPYSVRHCARFWYFTNNENALFIEGDDRRFTCHRANNRYANKIDYFKPIWAEVKDMNFCKNAFEYFATRKYEIRNVYECYNTQFKKEQKESNIPNGLKFLKEIIEDDFEGLTMDGDKIKAKDLGVSFKEWCSDGGIRFNIGTFKTQLKKLDIIDKSLRINGSKAKCYELNKETLKKAFSDFLKDPAFEFKMVAENIGERQEIRENGMGFGVDMERIINDAE